ncbi:MAG: lipopolysaccharide biosynthesis protein [Monoglobales bacterium]
MRIERTKNTIDGFVWGATGKIVNTVLPFVLRTVMIYKLGVEYLGLNSLFASILQVLSLSELGFSYACVYAMYKPIAEDDYKAVGAILSYLKKIYYFIGSGVLVLGLCLIPFLSQIIHGEVPKDINIHVLYLIYLANSVLSYFFCAYKSSLLSALQCNAVINKVGLITNTLLRIMQGMVLFIVPNYYLYVVLIPITTLINNIIKAYIVNKNYPQYLKKAAIDENIRADIKKRIAPLIGVKISTVLMNAADTLVISAFLGLTETALYNNYFFIMSSVQSIVYEIHSSMLAGVGNSLVVENKDNALKKFEMLHFINAWLVIFCTVCFICLYQPFMQIWVGKELMLPFGMVILFSAYFYFTTIQRIMIVYKDAAGIWKEDMFRCYASCAINILLNVVFVRYLGLYGVIGSSVFVSVVIDPLMAKTVYRFIFQKPCKTFYLYFTKDIFICCLTCMLFIVICSKMRYGWIGIIIRGLSCLIGVNLTLLLIYRKDWRFDSAKEWALRLINCVFK